MCIFCCWSEQRGLNSQPSEWQSDALPIELCPHQLEPIDGLEPPTYWLQISCSANWAIPAYFWWGRWGSNPQIPAWKAGDSIQFVYCPIENYLAAPEGLEPSPHGLTGRCSTDWAKEPYQIWGICADSSLSPRSVSGWPKNQKSRVMQLCMVQAERFELPSTALSVLPLTTWVHLHVATRMGVEPMSPERQSGIIAVIPTSRIWWEGLESNQRPRIFSPVRQPCTPPTHIWWAR